MQDKTNGIYLCAKKTPYQTVHMLSQIRVFAAHRCKQKSLVPYWVDNKKWSDRCSGYFAVC